MYYITFVKALMLNQTHQCKSQIDPDKRQTRRLSNLFYIDIRPILVYRH